MAELLVRTERYGLRKRFEMKRDTIIGFVVICLFLFSVCPLGATFVAANSHDGSRVVLSQPTVRGDSIDSTLSVPRSTPVIRNADGKAVTTPAASSQNHWWDITYWADTSGGHLPSKMNGSFVAVPNTIGNVVESDAVLYLPLNVAYGSSSTNCVWFQFDVQFGPYFGWYIWDVKGPGMNVPGDYHYTPIGLVYTPGHEYTFSLLMSGTNTVTFRITDITLGASWSCSNWAWNVPSLVMRFDQSMFSPSSAVEGYTTTSQLTNVPYFQTKVGYGITTFWHRAAGSGTPSGIATDASVGPSGYYYWQMHDGIKRTLNVVSAHDSPTPSTGSHTYSHGTSVTCNVASPVTEGNALWTCIGWSGSGSVPSSGSGTSVTFTITQDSSITWNWIGGAGFEDGFESGSFGSWDNTFFSSGETGAVVTTYTHHGFYGARFTSSGSTGYEKACCNKTIGSVGDIYVRGYFYVSRSGIADNNDRIFLLVLRSGANGLAYVGWKRTSGLLRWCLTMRNGASYVDTFSTSAPVNNRWYCVEIHWKKDPTNGIGELWVNGILVCSSPNKNTASYGNARAIQFGLAETYGCTSTTVYCDCAKISDAYIIPEPSSPTVFQDNFESGSFSKWTGTKFTIGETVTVTNVLTREGTYSAKMTSNANGGYERAYCYRNITSSSELYARGYFYISQNGINSDNDRIFLIVFRAGSNGVAYAGWKRTGGIIKWCLTMRDGTSYVDVLSSATPAINRWYCVEIHWKKDAANGISDLWVDGVKICSAVGKNTATYGNVNQVQAGLAEIYGCLATTAYCDVCVISKAYIGT